MTPTHTSKTKKQVLRGSMREFDNFASRSRPAQPRKHVYSCHQHSRFGSPSQALLGWKSPVLTTSQWPGQSVSVSRKVQILVVGVSTLELIEAPIPCDLLKGCWLFVGMVPLKGIRAESCCLLLKGRAKSVLHRPRDTCNLFLGWWSGTASSQPGTPCV